MVRVLKGQTGPSFWSLGSVGRLQETQKRRVYLTCAVSHIENEYTNLVQRQYMVPTVGLYPSLSLSAFL